MGVPSEFRQLSSSHEAVGAVCLSEQAGANPTYWIAVENLNADWTVAGA